MNAVLDPIVSEAETQEQADGYDRWFRAKVQQALDDSRPAIPHDEVVRRMEERFAALRKNHGH
jgi:hypothetical protein